VSLALNIYRSLSWGFVPFVRIYFQSRLKKGKEDSLRAQERWGYPSLTRDMKRPLIWVHAVSVGEAVSTLPLLKVLHEECRDAQLLLTTATVTSSKVMAKRLPPYVIHQFAPLDLPQVINRFLEAWEPDLAIGVESELWPNMLTLTQERGIPTLLLNGKLSERSFNHWKWLPSFISPILKKMTFIGAQTREDASRFKALKAPHVEVMPNLKLLSEPLSVDMDTVDILKSEIGNRPHFCAANTHPGEDEVIIEAHLELKKSHPNLLTILVPRHPERAQEIRTQIESSGLKVSQRSLGESITQETDIYLGDTLGEMGLFYTISQIVFLGATLAPKGGHNPIEPAQLGAFVLHGPSTYSNPQLFEHLKKENRAQLINNKDELVSAILAQGFEKKSKNHQGFESYQTEGIQKIREVLKPFLSNVRGDYAEDA